MGRKKHTMSSLKSHLYSVALNLAQGIGPVLYKDLIDHFGNPQNVFQASPSKMTEVLKKKSNLDYLISQEKKLLAKAQEFLAKHQQYNIEVVAYGEANYPLSLSEIYAPPSLLFHTPNVQFHNKHMISIVGTRNPSTYGKAITQELICALKKYNPVIVSGLAHGIDITAHETALEHDIPTIAVMGGGIDSIYPSDHTQTADRMIENKGGLISEHCLGAKPSSHHFPARNRIIAGLCDATIVIEAPEKSGALITAYYANQFNREVFTIPSHIYAKRSVGCHMLIKKHLAHLITDADDVAYMMGWSDTFNAKDVEYKKVQKSHLTSQEEMLMSILDKGAYHKRSTESLSNSLNLSLESTVALALQLEAKGIVEIMGNHCMVKGRSKDHQTAIGALMTG